MKILVKEKEAVIKMDLFNILRKHQMNVDEKAEYAYYDCVIIGETSYELQYLRNKLGHLSSRFLFIGSRYGVNCIKKEFPEHFILKLDKPFNSESLLFCINQLITQN